MTKTSNKASFKKSSSKASKGKLSSWLMKFSRSQLITVCAFVLVFAGTGSWLLYNSYAATWYCTAHEYYQYEPGTYHGTCVYHIQNALFYIGYAAHQPKIEASTDGVYGPSTAASVRNLQNWWNSTHRNQPIVTLYPDGIIGSATWGALCSSLQKYNAPTGGLAMKEYGALSCGHHPYGSAPV